MLAEVLKITQANAFAFALKAQYYHWNVEGPDFVQYHEFFGELYADVYQSVDAVAELIRTLDSYAPGTLTRLKELTTVDDSDTVPSALEMIKNLEIANTELLATITTAYEAAEEAKQYGISNYLQDRIQAHEKHGWMLKALQK